MATELVLLSEIPLTPDLLAQTAVAIVPGGKAISYNDEYVLVIDTAGKPVTTVFAPTVVHDPAEAATLLLDPPAAFGLWTEIRIAFDHSEASDQLVAAFAEAVRGTVSRKR